MELSASMDLSDADGLPVSIYDIHLVDEACFAIIGRYVFICKSNRSGFSGMVLLGRTGQSPESLRRGWLSSLALPRLLLREAKLLSACRSLIVSGSRALILSFPGSAWDSLVPRLCLGTHCVRGSASLRNACEACMHVAKAGRACKAVGSKAEPWNQYRQSPGTSTDLADFFGSDKNS